MLTAAELAMLLEGIDWRMVERTWQPLTTFREKLVNIGAKVVRHGRYVTFQLAEVAIPRGLFEIILRLIDNLRRRPAPA